MLNTYRFAFILTVVLLFSCKTPSTIQGDSEKNNVNASIGKDVVKNIDEFNEAVKNAQPGTTITMSNGIWKYLGAKWDEMFYIIPRDEGDTKGTPNPAEKRVGIVWSPHMPGFGSRGRDVSQWNCRHEWVGDTLVNFSTSLHINEFLRRRIENNNQWVKQYNIDSN